MELLDVPLKDRGVVIERLLLVLPELLRGFEQPLDERFPVLLGV